MALTPGEKADCIKALRQIRSMLGVCREIAEYNNIDDIARSVASLIEEAKMAEDDYEPADPVMYEVGRGGC
jgi:hypothetical protein